MTNKEIQPSSKGFPNAKKMRLSGTKIRSAKSIKGKKTLKHENDKIKVTKKGKIKTTKIGYFFDCKKIV